MLQLTSVSCALAKLGSMVPPELDASFESARSVLISQPATAEVFAALLAHILKQFANRQLNSPAAEHSR